MRRTVLVASMAAVLGGLALPSFAGELPVGVTYSTKDGASVSTTVNGQPGAGAAVHGTEVCVGLSYQHPACTHVDTPLAR